MNSFAVVLVEPQDSLNVGAVARAMGNFGFSDLRLVAPRHYDSKRALVSACGGAAVLSGLTIFSDCQAALGDFEDVVGFSCRSGRNRIVKWLLPAWIDQLAHTPRLKTALVFGPEDTGLRSEHVEQCRQLIEIPANPDNSSLNLAQAVLIVLYELSKLSPRLEQESGELASWNDYYQLDRIISEIGERSGFFRDGTPQPVPGLLRGIFKRTLLSSREIQLLIGFLSRVTRCLSGQVPLRED